MEALKMGHEIKQLTQTETFTPTIWSQLNLVRIHLTLSSYVLGMGALFYFIVLEWSS